jgi:hypothetical protein
MRITRYHLAATKDQIWDFEETPLDKVNLLVGDSGTGKTRFLNTILNFGKQAVAEKLRFPGDWDVSFEIGGVGYRWTIRIVNDKDKHSDTHVENERLIRIDRPDKPILLRDKSGSFFGTEKLPRLATDISTLTLLKEEEAVRDIHRGFRAISARRFFGDELGENFSFRSVPPPIIARLRQTRDLLDVQEADIGFHYRMHILKESHPQLYSEVLRLYKEAFPYIEDFGVFNFQDVMDTVSLPFRSPVFCIKERNIGSWIPVSDISSGMQKIFLLVLDTLLLSGGGVLMVDEYENSLGINAINFLPDLLYKIQSDCQFIITSHHPYIINSIPLESWRVFHRQGLSVKIRSGTDLKAKFGKSRQEHFIQLINDPFFNEGIE